ncbi:MFS transporter, SP family, general alpha glucoside:H+ symporter [Cryptococcus neoformans]|nr:MFS transporter, SP family, general alpha glucoside:H+ symporter [Cryptococcus neoformans var. grubii]OXC58304.1 MFS transporter, SP family, general alpha glucoside:H+ symporter [Cryptococcus neoformans var. grubii MW-RSA852]
MLLHRGHCCVLVHYASLRSKVHLHRTSRPVGSLARHHWKSWNCQLDQSHPCNWRCNGHYQLFHQRNPLPRDLHDCGRGSGYPCQGKDHCPRQRSQPHLFNHL